MIAQAVIWVLAVYAGIGAIFGVLFVMRGAAAIDHVASGAGIGFRIFIFPASAALWPLLLAKWIKGEAAQ